MSRLHQIILRPVSSEKTAGLNAQNKVVFRVLKDASKPEIRQAVEQLFGVKVVSVNTARMPGKPKRFGRQVFQRPGFKKAYVTLAPGEVIDLFALEGEDEFGPEDFADEVEE